ncbi:phage tail tape measure protein [Novosphingobium colocasiae]
MVDIQQKAELSDRATAQMANNIIAAAAAARQLPEDMRAGVDVLSGFGLDPRKAALMIAPIGRLGTAFKVDLSDGAAAAYANLNNLKVPITQTSAALDVMAAAGNAGAFEVKDMARHFPSLTAQMQALGQKGVPAVADLSAALQIARRGAGDADEAANNVQNLLSKINSPGTIAAFKKNFGVDLPNALKRAYAEGKKRRSKQLPRSRRRPPAATWPSSASRSRICRRSPRCAR